MRALSHASGGRRKSLLLLWYLAAGLAGSAWLLAADAVRAEDPYPCADAGNTIEIRECLSKAHTSADAELNVVWKEVMDRVDGADYLPGKERKAWKGELLTSQPPGSSPRSTIAMPWASSGMAGRARPAPF